MQGLKTQVMEASSWVWLLDNKNSHYTAKLITIYKFQRQVTLSSTAHKFLNLYDREFSVGCFTMLYARANKLESIWRKRLIGMSSRHSSGQSKGTPQEVSFEIAFIRKEIQWRFLPIKSIERYGQSNTTFAVEMYLRLSLRLILRGGVNRLTVVQNLVLTHPYIKAWDKLWIHGRIFSLNLKYIRYN
jgi:hypothetical protein